MTLNVSQLLDGQVEGSLVCPVLAEVAARSEHRDRFTIYALIGDSLRGNSTPDDGFSVRILGRMVGEGVRIEPGYDPLAS